LKVLLQDIHFAKRLYCKSPMLTFGALATLAIGIGANAAVFSIVHAVLLQPFPYPHPSSVVLLWGSHDLHTRPGISTSQLENLAYKSTSFEGVAPYLSGFTVSLGEDEFGRIPAAYVGTNFLSILGTPPLYGSGFSANVADAQGERGVIISFGIWRERFGGDREIIGKSIVLNRQPSVIVGVMPAGFFFPDPNVSIWMPFSQEVLRGTNREAPFFRIVGRLRPGVPLGLARLETDQLTRSTGIGGKSPSGVFLIENAIVSQYSTALWTLLAATSCLLLIACANLANLLLARAIARQREIAIRVALGASGRRILRQLLTESSLLGLTGGFLGVLLAHVSLHFFRQLNFADIPRIADARLNINVLLFAGCVSLLAGLLFGIVPAWHACRPNIVRSLTPNASTSTLWGRRHLSHLLAATEIALSTLLLVCAGLFVRSFIQITHIHWGFDAENLLAIRVKPAGGEFRAKEREREFIEGILTRLKRMPGVTAVAMSEVTPADVGSCGMTALGADGHLIRGNDWDPLVARCIVSSEFFRTLRIPVLAGRGFSDHDDPLDNPKVVIDERVAAQIGGMRAVGVRLDFMRTNQEAQRESRNILINSTPEPVRRQFIKSLYDKPSAWEKEVPIPTEVVGVTGSARLRAFVTEEEVPVIYLDYRQFEPPFLTSVGVTFLVRTAGPAPGIAEAAEKLILSAEPSSTVEHAVTITSLIRRATGGRGTNTLTLGLSVLFGSLSALLAGMGVYAVMSYTVSCRAHEIGVRMALGASSGNIFCQVFREGLETISAGLVVGLLAALAATRLISQQLFGISATDPLTLCGIAMLMTTVGSAAILVPAFRSIRINPSINLRLDN
jgi:predicted permease